MAKKKVIIMGAAGRDFHNFNTYFRGNDEYDVVAFTATQIPNIEGRKYPTELAGNEYPNGIPIYPEAELTDLIKKSEVELVVFSYSDVRHEYVMHKASEVMAAGANFMVMGGEQTMLKSKKPVIAICAVRTGCGKSQTTRYVSKILKDAGKKVVAIRHPMPYGDLNAQRVQRFADYDDMIKNKCTIEEMEEYEPHIAAGNVVYAGVDFGDILAEAEKEADVILWDGGNNDLPFYKPDLFITIVDPHRPGHELTYFPGETNLRMADVVIINKEESADWENIQKVRESIQKVNPGALVVDAASPISVDDPSLIRGKKVLVVEDGPTLTHGEMKYGAGIVAAKKLGAAEIVDPRPYLVESIAATFKKYPYIGTLLPAMGYGDKQVADLEKTINRVECDTVVVATPIDLRKVVKIDKPATRVRYDLQVIGEPDLRKIVNDFLAKQ
ncbi:MAG TPA: GTPase [Bacteroidetes bacterium]|nr:GTPase [Bacteroidota bacterium]